MSVELKSQEELKENEPAPPAENQPDPQAPHPETAEEKANRLEIENAELRGKQSVLEKQPEPVKATVSAPRSTQETEWATTKATVTTHLGSLDDEKFEEHYKMSKADARVQVTQGDNQIQTIRTNERTARIEAENRLFRKYKDYGDFEDEIRESISDAAPEIRQDPDRLSKYLDRHYKAASASKPKPPTPPEKKEGDPMNRRIVNDFVPPNAQPDPNNPHNLLPKKQGEISDENKAICGSFGIESEEERKKFMSPDIEMNMGGGTVLRNAKKGFEKIKP